MLGSNKKLKIFINLFKARKLPFQLKIWYKLKTAGWSTHRNYYKNNDIRYIGYSKQEKFANLGAGSHFYHPKWYCFDFYNDGLNKFNNTCISWDFLKKKDLPHKYSLIYSSHVIEHIPRQEIKSFLEIAHKSLNENGTIRLVFPDADLAYNAYKENRYNFFEIYESRINYSIPDDHKIEYLLLFFFATRKTRREEFNLARVLDIRSKFKELNQEDFLDYLNEDIFENSSNGQDHVNWFNYNKIEKLLKSVGFKEVYRSSYGQSKCPPMREVPLFDGWLPCLSSYVEAVK